MTRKTLVFCLAALVAACDQLPTPTQPSPNPPPPPPRPEPAVAQPISVGQEVTGTFQGAPIAYEFSAPADGRLMARLSWDVWFNGSLLTLRIGDSEHKPSGPNWSPVVGTWSVTAGQTYRLIVAGGGTDWFYNDAFVLTTQLE